MCVLKHVVEGVLVTALVALTPVVAHAQSVVHPTPKDTVIMTNGQPQSGTISDAQGQMMFVVSGTGMHVLSVNGQPVRLGSPEEKAAIVRVNAALEAYEKNGPSASPATGATQTTGAGSPAAPIASTAATTPGVEFGNDGHVSIHRETSTVELTGKDATVTFKDSPMPFQMQYKHDGLIGGIGRSASRAGRSFATSGWTFSMSGRLMFDSRNGGAVPGGNGGIVMKAARELLAAMNDAQAQAVKDGKSYSPVGKDALQDLISAHPQ
jgi:hypothetical protein